MGCRWSVFMFCLVMGLPACDQGRSSSINFSTVSVPQPTKKPKPLDPNPRFVDVAKEAGLTRILWCGGTDKDHILESVGAGAAMLDYDEDGRLDLFVVNAWALDEDPSRVRAKGKHALYRNLGEGRFEDVTDRAGIADDGWGCGVCCADYDNDGHVDIYMTSFGPNRLYRNQGDGTFEQVAERAGVAHSGWGSGAAFFDADHDGDLDLYIANYIDATLDQVLAARRTTLWQDTIKVMAGPFGLRGGKDRFYENNGDGAFRDATEESGMADLAESYGLGVLASDLDNDGDVDVYVANDSNPNFLYRNNGQGKFEDIGTWSGAGLSGEGVAQASMGVDAGDFDGDGLEEIFVTHFCHDYSTLYRNLGGLNFEDISVGMRLKEYTYMSLSWGCAFFDFDQDGDLDIIVANGHIYPQVDQAPSLKDSYRQRPTLLRNDNGKLTEVSRDAGPGFQSPASARGVAVGDYDDDGDLDLFMTAIDAAPILLRNETPRQGHWLKLRLLNRHGSPAIQARATLSAAGKKQMREIRSGSTYQSQNSPELHFGLGEVSTVDTLEIRWPRGGRTLLENPGIDRTITIREPAGPSTTREVEIAPRPLTTGSVVRRSSTLNHP